MRILIIGAGGHGQVVADILQRIRDQGRSVEPIGFLDDNAAFANTTLLGLPIWSPTNRLSQIPHDAVILGIGDNSVRKYFFERLTNAGEKFVTAIHPTAILAPSAQIGIGTVICANAVVGVNARVGANVILNTSCTVDHENIVQDHAHISVGVHLGGGATTIGAGALVGIGATVMPGIQIGAWSVVGAGALAHRNVPERVTVVGVPARILKVSNTRA